ncbi:hypothetical protein [Nonomuraea sp. 10N515B]|uniref:hypothetical protein n=1 Tax=Nonomuraea sp. 10N515B TaxID=3457422 RepID=UPI003FCD4D20
MNLLPINRAADLLASRLTIPQSMAEQLLAEHPVRQIRFGKRTRVFRSSVLALANRIATQAEAQEWLATMRPTTHPYSRSASAARPRPTWRGGPRLSHADERTYLDEQDDM